jgi:hypothetical protein
METNLQQPSRFKPIVNSMPPRKFNKTDRILLLRFDAPGTVTQVLGRGQYKIKLDTPVYYGSIAVQTLTVSTWEIETL